MIRSLRSYGRHLATIIVFLIMVSASLAFFRSWVVAGRDYESGIVDRFDYLYLFLDDKLGTYRKTVQFWGIKGISEEAEKFMMSFPEIRGLLVCDLKGAVEWSNFPYVKPGMSVPPEMLSGRWIPSPLFGDVSSPGLVISVPLHSGWMLCEIDSHFLLSSMRIRPKDDSVIALVTGAGTVIYGWETGVFAPMGSVIPKALLAERNQTLDLFVGRIRAFSRMLIGGLYMVSFFPEAVLVRESLVQAGTVALLTLLGSGLFLLLFWRGYGTVALSFGKWVNFLVGASDRVRRCDNSMELSEYLVDFDRQVKIGGLEPSFQEEAQLKDAFGGLLSTLSEKEESLMAYLEETRAMEDSLRVTNSELELAIGQLENILCLSQGVTDGRTLQGMASAMATNLRKTFRSRYACLIALSRGIPYVWGEAGDSLEAMFSESLEEGINRMAKSDLDLAIPVPFMDRTVGYVVIQGCSSYPKEKVSDILRHFALTLGGLLHANELLMEVRSSFHYFALRMQAFTEIYHEETGGHIARVGEYAAFIAGELGKDDSYVEDIRIYAQLHDLGKVRVNRSILTKPGSLTDNEFQEIKKHASYGAEMLGDSAWLDMARNICLNHHEKWDGSGYPMGLSGEAIPLEGRIVALCDVYDALREKRSYKPSFSHEAACRILLDGDGRVMPGHFDPEVLDVFRKNNLHFRTIHDAISDDHEIDQQIF